MISYCTKNVEIEVFLENKKVGTITGSAVMGYWYKPKGGEPGMVFDTVEQVKRSIEGNDETLD